MTYNSLQGIFTIMIGSGVGKGGAGGPVAPPIFREGGLAPWSDNHEVYTYISTVLMSQAFSLFIIMHLALISL